MFKSFKALNTLSMQVDLCQHFDIPLDEALAQAEKLNHLGYLQLSAVINEIIFRIRHFATLGVTIDEEHIAAILRQVREDMIKSYNIKEND